MLHKNFLYLVFVSLAVEAAERPWWEREIMVEQKFLVQNNEDIEARIQKEQSYFTEMLLRDYEAFARRYLEANEAIWRGSDEIAIRNEIELISSKAKPYFDSKRNLLELEAVQNLR